MSHIIPVALRRAARLQRRHLFTTAIIVVTMATALGSSATVFSVVDPLLLRSLPFARSSELETVTSSFPLLPGSMGLSGPEALELPQMTDAFAGVGVVAFEGVTVGEDDRAPVRAAAAQASAGALDALRPAVILGRLYGTAEDRPGAPGVAVLAYGFWVRAFGADPGIVGRVVRINGAPTTVVGVFAPGVDLLNHSIEIWLPLTLTPATAGDRAEHRFTVIARRTPGLSHEAAAASLGAAVARWQVATGEFHSPTPRFHPLHLQPLSAATRGPTTRPLLALGGAVALVMLIACANVCNLLLARSESRRYEIATQIALGAARSEVLRRYILEAMLLVGAGALAGVALAAFALAALKGLGPALPHPDEIGLDARVLGFALGLSLLSAAIVGAVPFLALDATNLLPALQSGGRGPVGRGGRRRVQHALVAVQLGTAIALGTAAVLTGRSLIALMRVDPGFRPAALTVAQVSLPERAYQSDARVFALYDAALARLRTTPGVAGAAAMSGLPPLRAANNTTFSLDGARTLDHRSMPQVDFIQHVTPRYFTVMGVRLLSGRAFDDGDVETSAPVAIVNETLAHRFWPGQPPLGRRLRPAGLRSPWFTVIGVVNDARQAGLHEPPGGELYVPYRQGHLLFDTWLPRAMYLVVAPQPNAAPGRAIEQVVHAIEPAAAVSGIRTMESVVSDAVAQPRLVTVLLSAFALIAVLLAAIGVNAVAAVTVAARTTEFGVRIALGATPAAVMRHVVAGGAAPVVAGLAGGTLASVAAARYLASMIYGAPWTPGAIAGAAGALTCVALLSMLAPALRASRIDPIDALRTL